MGRNAKVGIAAVVVLVLLGIAVVTAQGPIIIIAIAVIGGAGIFLLLRQDDGDDHHDDDEGGTTRTKPKPKPGKAKTGKARLDEILDDKASKSGPKAKTRSPAPTTPPAGGLPTWTPGSLDAGDTSVDDDVDDTDTGGDSWDTWEKEWPQGEDDVDTIVLDEDDDPLGSLDRLDDIDPVAEVERLDAEDPFTSLRGSIEIDDTVELDELEVDLDDEPEPSAATGSAFSFAAAPAVINEEVSTADDIMAASTATELHVEEAGDSELARLLAKVQARLSAYE